MSHDNMTAAQRPRVCTVGVMELLDAGQQVIADHDGGLVVDIAHLTDAGFSRLARLAREPRGIHAHVVGEYHTHSGLARGAAAIFQLPGQHTLAFAPAAELGALESLRRLLSSLDGQNGGLLGVYDGGWRWGRHQPGDSYLTTAKRLADTPLSPAEKLALRAQTWPEADVITDVAVGDELFEVLKTYSVRWNQAAATQRWSGLCIGPVIVELAVDLPADGWRVRGFPTDLDHTMPVLADGFVPVPASHLETSTLAGDYEALRRGGLTVERAASAAELLAAH